MKRTSTLGNTMGHTARGVAVTAGEDERNKEMNTTTFWGWLNYLVS